MFKRILSSFIGSLAAMIVAGMLTAGIIIAIIIAALADSSEYQVDEHSILHINLSGPFDERQGAIDIQSVVMDGGQMPSHLDEYLSAIALAADDPNIDGIFIECSGSDLGYAGRQELVQALQQFKESGKWIHAYGDAYTQGDYYVASVADRVCLNPVGQVDVRGLESQTPFFKNALDKLGVDVQVVKVGQFKSAVEPFLLTEASEPSKLQTRVFMNAIWHNITKTIAANRQVTAADVNMWADSLLSTMPAQKLVDMKVVDQLCYRREFDSNLRKLTKLDGKDHADDDLRLVTPADYMTSNPQERIAKAGKTKKHKKSDGYFAVYYAQGDIVDDGKDGIVGPTVVDDIIGLADDDDVKGLVLRVNSGGGSAFASEQIWEALQYFKSKDKPFYVSMGDYAASGGYYISCGADRIYADANTLTGSIGIFGMIPCIKGLLNDHLGVNISTVATNPDAAGLMSITQPMTEQQRVAMQRHIDEGYRLFTGRVAAGRSLPVDSVLSIAEGRVWSGTNALRIGLVDQLGGINDAIAAMASKLNMPADNYVSYPEMKLSAFESLLLNSAGDVKAAMQPDIARQLDGMTPVQAQRHLWTLKRLTDRGRIQAAMEPLTLE